jgi:hypothetical protein
MTAHCSKINPEYPSLGKIDEAFAKQLAQSIRNAQPNIGEELKAAYQRIAELSSALMIARSHLVTLGGDKATGDDIQATVLNVIDDAHSDVVLEPFPAVKSGAYS